MEKQLKIWNKVIVIKALKAEIEKFVNMLYNLNHLGSYYVTLESMLKRDAGGTPRAVEYRTCGFHVFETDKPTPEQVKVMQAWLDTCPALITSDMLTGLMKSFDVELMKVVKVTDNRTTLEQLLAEEEQKQRRKAEYEAEKPERERKEREEKEAIENDPNLAHSGESNIIITLNRNFDNSDGMTDYYHPHYCVGTKALRVVRKQAETQSIAREAIVGSGLESLKWEWHTEKYSMGHGNYLQSEPVEGLVPEEANREGRAGHYTIEFDRGNIPKHESFRDYTQSRTPNDTQTGEQVVMSGAIIRRNLEKDGIEIQFPEKPDRVIIDTLKGNGYKWSNFAKVWYIKYSPERLEKAQELVGK